MLTDIPLPSNYSLSHPPLSFDFYRSGGHAKPVLFARHCWPGCGFNNAVAVRSSRLQRWRGCGRLCLGDFRNRRFGCESKFWIPHKISPDGLFSPISSTSTPAPSMLPGRSLGGLKKKPRFVAVQLPVSKLSSDKSGLRCIHAGLTLSKY